MTINLLKIHLDESTLKSMEDFLNNPFWTFLFSSILLIIGFYLLRNCVRNIGKYEAFRNWAVDGWLGAFSFIFAGIALIVRYILFLIQ
jgi:hypothetical protein